MNEDLSQVTWDQPETAQPMVAQQVAKPKPVTLDQVSWDEDVYGTLPAQAKLAVQEFAQGFAGPAATAVERGLSQLGVPGLSYEERKRAEEVNPTLSTLAQTAGLGASLLSGVGEAALLSKAGAAASKLVSTGAQLSRARAAGAAALRGAIELGGFEAGEELSKAIARDPNQTAQSVIGNVGLSSLLGATGGAALGFAMPKWFEHVAPEVETNLKTFQNGVNGLISDAEAEAPLKTIKEAGLFEALTKQKPQVKELLNISEKHNWPLYEGQVSASPLVQEAEDALLQGPPTVAGIQRRQAYEKAWDSVNAAVESATSAPLAKSEAEVGNLLKEGLTAELEKQYAPIRTLYNEIEPYKTVIPISERSTQSISRNFAKLIDEQGLVKGTPAYNFVHTFAEGAKELDNLAQLANFRTQISRSADPTTKYIAGDLIERLNNLEDRAIKRFAETMKTGEAKDRILELVRKSEEAKASYSQFREKLQTLGNSLGKKKIYGPQNFLDFIEDINPQSLAKKTFAPGNVEFSNYLAKNFPEQMAIIRDYQRALIKEGATKEGELNTKAVLKAIDKLHPEQKGLLYSKSEQELLSDAQKYVGSFPKSFNPSGTAHMSAFRAFFEHPTGATIANLRDAGIRAFIKAVQVAGKLPTSAAQEVAAEMLKTVGPKILTEEAIDAQGFGASVRFVHEAMKARSRTVKAADAVFTGAMPAIRYLTHDEVKKIDQRLNHLEQNPHELFQQQSDVAKYLPEHGQAVGIAQAQAIQYLNAVKPKSVKMRPLDSHLPMSTAQIAPYIRKLQIAHDPMTVFHHIEKGTLLPEDVATLKAVAPAKYQFMVQQTMDAMTKHLGKGMTIPYKKRQSLSLFLGDPLDSTFTPQAISSIQRIYQGMPRGTEAQQMPAGVQGKPKRSTAALGHIGKQLMTGEQAREARRNK